jgi:hypothetical protein
MTGTQHHAGDSARPARKRGWPVVRGCRPLGPTRPIRLLLLAWAVCYAGDLAAVTAASVYAYRAGGAGLVGVLGLAKGVVAGEGIVVHVHPLAGECWPGSPRRPGSAGPMVSGLQIRNKTQTTI